MTAAQRPSITRSRARGRRNDVAIYSPFASVIYEWSTRGSASAIDDENYVPGGAAVQTVFLARGLARLGSRVTHVVYPMPSRTEGGDQLSGVELTERSWARTGGPFSRLGEAWAIWRSLLAADAAVLVLRGSGGDLSVGALFSLVHRRKLVFAAANDLDFHFSRPDRDRLRLRLLRWAFGWVDAAVFQTDRQRALAVEAGCRFPEEATIPSFAEPAAETTVEPEEFLWVGRIVSYKRPLHYVRLAREIPEARFRMVVIETTETPKDLACSVYDAAESVPNLEVIQKRPREEILELIAASYAIVSTSEYEGMPNVFLEAWARGVPALSFDFDPDGRIAAFDLGVVAHGDWRAFVAAARSLSRAGSRERAALAKRCRRYVDDHHSPDAVARDWHELLTRLYAVPGAKG